MSKHIIATAFSEMAKQEKTNELIAAGTLAEILAYLQEEKAADMSDADHLDLRVTCLEGITALAASTKGQDHVRECEGIVPLVQLTFDGCLRLKNKAILAVNTLTVDNPDNGIIVVTTLQMIFWLSILNRDRVYTQLDRSFRRSLVHIQEGEEAERSWTEVINIEDAKTLAMATSALSALMGDTRDQAIVRELVKGDPALFDAIYTREAENTEQLITMGIIPALLKCIHAPGIADGLHIKLMGMLIRAGSNPEQQNLVREASGLDILCAYFMEAKEANPATSRCLETLSHVSRGNQTSLVCLDKNGITPNLVATITTPEAPAYLVAAAAMLLASIAEGEPEEAIDTEEAIDAEEVIDAKKVAIATKEALCGNIKRAGGIEALIALLAHTDPATREYAAEALYHISRSTILNIRQYIAERETPVRLADLLSQEDNSSRCRFFASSLMEGLLTFSPGLHQYGNKPVIIHALIEQLSPSPDVRITYCCSNTLLVLGQQNVTLHAALATGIHAYAQLLNHSNESIVSIAIKLLQIMITDHRNYALFNSSGVTQSLVDALRQEAHVSGDVDETPLGLFLTEAMSMLTILAQTAEGKQLIGQAGAIRYCKHFLGGHERDAALTLLDRLTTDSEANCKALADCGGVVTLTKCLNVPDLNSRAAAVLERLPRPQAAFLSELTGGKKGKFRFTFGKKKKGKKKGKASVVASAPEEAAAAAGGGGQGGGAAAPAGDRQSLTASPVRRRRAKPTTRKGRRFLERQAANTAEGGEPHSYEL